MAKIGSITLQAGIVIANAYLRPGGISGGKQSGYWQADIQVFSDGGTAAQAYEQARAEDSATADPTAMETSRVHASLPLLNTPWTANTNPYTALYTTLSVLYPSLTDA